MLLTYLDGAGDLQTNMQRTSTMFCHKNQKEINHHLRCELARNQTSKTYTSKSGEMFTCTYGRSRTQTRSADGKRVLSGNAVANVSGSYTCEGQGHHQCISQENSSLRGAIHWKAWRRGFTFGRFTQARRFWQPRRVT